ncbi:Lysosome-associated membrane glycoprotein 1 [Clonorchis sinensis]|uniref:Lysosome-associated membrane glycoprotein 5 n=1 Tax=Clonorchis sinensis TaxID=79923 RepID=A0A8T1MVS8_CLOSI|nr:Lysosome-associated membrane glycoprotein 1 [Clonorchis sinensis]
MNTFAVLLLSLVPLLIDSQNTSKTTTTTPTSTSTPPDTTVTPAPTVPSYSVLNGTDICLLVQMNIKLGITYFNTKGEPLMRNFYINSTRQFDIVTNGTCGIELETLMLTWWPEQSQSKDAPSWSLGLQFHKRADGHFSLDFMDLRYITNTSLFPDTNETSIHYVSRNDSQFTCPVGSYFQCMAAQSSKLTKPSSIGDVVVQPEVFVTLSDLKAEAFRSGNSPIFVGSMRECSADYVPNKVVPIVVGVALAAMIIIALITFVISSRRRQRGYQEI